MRSISCQIASMLKPVRNWERSLPLESTFAPFSACYKSLLHALYILLFASLAASGSSLNCSFKEFEEDFSNVRSFVPSSFDSLAAGR